VAPANQRGQQLAAVLVDLVGRKRIAPNLADLRELAVDDLVALAIEYSGVSRPNRGSSLARATLRACSSVPRFRRFSISRCASQASIASPKVGTFSVTWAGTCIGSTGLLGVR
jgi:hypothetical protein